MINITIDGKTIEVPEGTTVLRAAQSAGVDIPTLCDHPHLTPYGGCRLCLVEVEGYRTLQSSCTLPATNNMVVKTDSKKVLDARKFVLTLIFSERNHFCPYCQVSGGDCALQNAAYHEGMTHWPLQPNWKPYPVDASHPYIILENNRCILCRRCVRACGELIGNFTLGFEERGAKSILVADTGVPLGESTCISCGSCVQVCPTGALIDRWSAYLGKETNFDITNTVCVGCSLGCNVNVISRDNNLVRVEGDWDSTFNEGVICEIGRFEPMTEKCDRVHTPMVRKDGVLKAATWEEALSAAAKAFEPLKSKSTGGIAALISSRQPIEALSSFKSFFDSGLGATFVSSLEENSSLLKISEHADSLAHPFEGKILDIDNSDAVMLLSTNLYKNHQVAGFLVKRNLPNGMKLLVVDKNENAFDLIANKALKPMKGSTEVVLKALSAAVIRLGLAKGKTLTTAEDLPNLAGSLGITTDDLLDAAFVIAASEKPVIVYDNQENLVALQDFAKLINAKLVSMKGNANSLAISQLHLEKPFKANGFKAGFIALGDDEVSQKLLKEIESIPFKVVQATYSSPLTASADILLPATNWLEQGGHYISADGRIQLAAASLVPAEGVYSIEKTIKELADTMGVIFENNWQKAIHDRIAPVEIEN